MINFLKIFLLLILIFEIIILHYYQIAIVSSKQSMICIYECGQSDLFISGIFLIPKDTEVFLYNHDVQSKTVYVHAMTKDESKISAKVFVEYKIPFEQTASLYNDGMLDQGRYMSRIIYSRVYKSFFHSVASHNFDDIKSTEIIDVIHEIKSQVEKNNEVEVINIQIYNVKKSLSIYNKNNYLV